LPGEFGGAERGTKVQLKKVNRIKILCVSTLEPRKNHRVLINACLRMQKRFPKLDWELTLVGNRYAGAPEIPEFVEKIAKNNSRIKWLGVVDDDVLQKLYKECAFTVYPSVIEGFGMPILESIWYGKPCICYEKGVMSELAKDGGCLVADVKSEDKLADAVYKLANDEKLLNELSKQAIKRKIKSWKDYVSEFVMILKRNARKMVMEDGNSKSSVKYPTWDQIFYSDCLCENWQMNHSERLALMSLLVKHKPKCSIEIGTFKGGSLSLMAQYSKCVFSLDIDPDISEKFKQFKNVSFLTGYSQAVLPLLFDELDRNNIPVDFILIDGDYSEEGVRRDVDMILSYIPKRPLFVMMHDCFNPGCRGGIVKAQWEKSPYVHFVDVDFIPGRLVEHGGESREMRGGLGLAYLLPIKRIGDLIVDESSRKMYEMFKFYK
jgi:hypothetical protein